jgi:hypothetical protein
MMSSSTRNEFAESFSRLARDPNTIFGFERFDPSDVDLSGRPSTAAPVFGFSGLMFASPAEVCVVSGKPRWALLIPPRRRA